MDTTAPPPVAALARTSARLGNDIDLIQGAGGNTSVKLDGRLWVKASGTRLGEALDRPVFVVLDLPSVLAELEGAPDDGALTVSALAVDGAAQRLRPSIETAFHAALPERYVVHTHSTAVIAHVCRSDGRDVVAEKLAGLPWAWVPYVKPGIGLARAMLEARRDDGTGVYLLANHGAVFAGNDLAAVEAMLAEVERRLATPLRAPSAPSGAGALDRQADHFDMRPAGAPDWHQLALDADAFRLATCGTLYPDHAIFLGDGCWRAEPDGGPVNPSTLARVPIPFLLVRGVGCLVSSDLSEAQTAMLHALSRICRMVPPTAPVHPLETAEVGYLLDWDAEKYRQKLEADRRDGASPVSRH